MKRSRRVILQWIGTVSMSLSIREHAGPITSNTSRFIPHAIV